jgi:hypothetical protein
MKHHLRKTSNKFATPGRNGENCFTSALESSTRPESKMLSLQFFLRKGVVVGYVGLNQTLKDLQIAQASKPTESHIAICPRQKAL